MSRKSRNVIIGLALVSFISIIFNVYSLFDNLGKEDHIKILEKELRTGNSVAETNLLNDSINNLKKDAELARLQRADSILQNKVDSLEACNKTLETENQNLKKDVEALDKKVEVDSNKEKSQITKDVVFIQKLITNLLKCETNESAANSVASISGKLDVLIDKLKDKADKKIVSDVRKALNIDMVKQANYDKKHKDKPRKGQIEGIVDKLDTLKQKFE